MTAPSPLTEDQRYGAALASLGAGPGTVRRFLAGYGPAEAWEALATGRHRADPDQRYRAQAVPPTLEGVSAGCERGDVAVMVLGRPGYPPALAEDRQAPAVRFAAGDVTVLEGRPRVAVVGTRAATPYGRETAAELGAELARAGVVVVSGLAPGIDSAAHAGALGTEDGAPAGGVLGAALDAPASPVQVALRAELAVRGVLLGELPPGVHSARWWFAVRNRVMAALAHVVVVVECHHRGASLHTVAAGLARGVTIMAVPGSVRSPASAGTNQLLVDGAAPARHADDVLAAVDLAVVGRPRIAPPVRPRRPARPVATRGRATPLPPTLSRVRAAPRPRPGHPGGRGAPQRALPGGGVTRPGATGRGRAGGRRRWSLDPP